MRFLSIFLFLFMVNASNESDEQDDYVGEIESITDRDIEQVKQKVYMDYQASSPCDPRVFSSLDLFIRIYGNPHSTHINGRLLDKFFKRAKIQVAKVINAKPRNIYFTSGATESNNLAIKGVVNSLPKGTHIITSKIEHKSVLEVFHNLEKYGYEVTYLDVDRYGIVDPLTLEKAIKPNTKFISIMAVNNEIGTIQDISAIGSICFKHNIIFHTDCAQAFGKIKLDVKKMKIDLLSISGHKIYAPKGVGALYFNAKRLKRKGLKKFIPMIHGGGQQNNIRPGTLPVELVNALGVASDIALHSMNEDALKCNRIQRMIHKTLMEYNELKKKEFVKNGGKVEDFEPTFILNGPQLGRKRTPVNLNYSVKGVDAEDLISELELKGFIISGGSACNAHSGYSHVIDAIDPEMENPPAAIRISFGRFSGDSDGELFAEALIQSVEFLQKKYPDKGVRSCKKSKDKVNIKNKKENKIIEVKEQTDIREKNVQSKPKLSKAEKDKKKELEELDGLIEL